MDTLERIVPADLERSGTTGTDTYQLHIERYKFASTFATGPALLDIACGVGYGTKFLADTCRGVIQADGVDLSQEAIEYAREHYRDDRVRYFCEDAMTFRGLGEYDMITSLETIEHLPDPKAFLRHVSSLLKRSGILVGSVPTTPSMDGNPHHVTDFSERSIRVLGRSCGLEEIAVMRQIQPFRVTAVISGKERRLERTRVDLLRFYLANPHKAATRLWSTARFGFVNRYATIAWRKPK